MYQYYFEIAYLGIYIESPMKILFQPCMLPFQKGRAKKDLLYRLRWNDRIDAGGERINKKNFTIFAKNDHYVRIKYISLDKNSIPMMLSKVKENSYEICIPVELQSKQWLFEKGNILDFLGLEEPLLNRRAFILHSSFISWQGNGILFTAPSGTGKSTQADLWEKYEKAEIYNGDRTILRKIDDEFIGFGSPYAGSSGIYRNESAPVKAIIVLSQSKKNQIERLNGRQAFLPLYKETLMNTWNSKYMNQMIDLLKEASELIPIYHLACRPDKEAVMLVREAVLSIE